jgi:hypothetical protein
MFFAYPNNPIQIGQIIESAVEKVNAIKQTVTTWKAMNSAGAFIARTIYDNIEETTIFIADITVLNFNVTYEIGYAIGQKKKILLVKNASLNEGKATIAQVGIFDTISYSEYTNSDELYNLIINAAPLILLGDLPKINTQAPVYIIEQKYKTDYALRITTRIRKARYIYRSFDPTESPRLSAYDAINQVAQSFGVLVSLLSNENKEFEVHNLRAAFIAGLSDGMGKITYILQHNDTPVPIDYRDFVEVFYSVNDIDNIIADFAADIAEAYQMGSEIAISNEATLLQQLDFGASSAENEMRTLQSYYLKTDAYNKAVRGEVQLVVGRKGSGKSAIFLQIRDKERSKSNNVVLDLKPDGYQLIKFKELILKYLQEGTFHHTIIAFWEYVLLLEICHKVLENDQKRHLNNSKLYESYRELEKKYKGENYLRKGDFSERIVGLMENLTVAYKKQYGEKENVRLSVPEITTLLYKGDISKLKEKLIEYLKLKDKVWLLLDNIDKGWPSSGLENEDFIIMRTLIDALRKIQRQFDKERIEMHPIVFLRNDVYELLVEKTSDRQKEAKELLDWVDSDLLREIIKLRILSSLDFGETKDFSTIWQSLCVSHYKGEETSQYLIERSLMRPRFLINLLNHCKGFAVNLNHNIIQIEDITKGFNSYSMDILTDISYELRDVLPESENILYNFIGCTTDLNLLDLKKIIKYEIIGDTFFAKLINLLLWHGFLGIKYETKNDIFIYNVNYNMHILNGLIDKFEDKIIYTINPAFMPALLIEE